MSSSFADRRGFSAFATIVFTIFAALNGFALVLGIVLQRIGYATVGQACGLVIFGVLALIYARRWRRSRARRIAPNDVER